MNIEVIVSFWPFQLSKIYVWLLPQQQKSRTYQSQLILCIAEITSFSHGKFQTTVFYINTVMKEEVVIFEWPSYIIIILDFNWHSFYAITNCIPI